MKKVFKKTSVKNLSPYYQFGIDYFGHFSMDLPNGCIQV